MTKKQTSKKIFFKIMKLWIGLIVIFNTESEIIKWIYLHSKQIYG